MLNRVSYNKNKMVKNIDAVRFAEMVKKEPENLEIIDVREQEEYDEVRVKNSKLMPVGNFIESLDKINWGKQVVFICRSGARSAFAAEVASKYGKNAMNLEAGMNGLEKKFEDLLERGK